MIPQEYFVLGPNGLKVPSRGFGTFQPEPRAYPPGSVKKSVLTAFKVGYCHVDTSLRYDNGRNETEIGEAVRERTILREDIFLVTKLLVTCKPAKRES